MTVESDPQALLDYMVSLHVVILMEYSSITILIFDYFLTLGLETRLVWNSSWNLGKVLFFLTRYLPFIAVFTTFSVDAIRGIGLSVCSKLTQAAVYCSVVDIIIAEVILTLRVCALWAGNRKIILFLVAISMTLAIIPISRLAQVHVKQNAFGQDLHASYGVCPPYFANSDAMTTSWITLASYEIVILALTVFKAIEHYRQPGRSSFINIFYADGLSYNFFILACSIANIVVRYKATSEYINLLTSLQPVIHSVLTSRMMLHLRQSSVQNISAWRPSSIRFAEGPIGEDRDNGAEGQIDAQMDARSWFTEDVQRYR